jgi:hypothetical protein
MVSQDLLEILRCPACVREKDGLLDLVMLIDEGDKWIQTSIDSLPVPPPKIG